MTKSSYFDVCFGGCPSNSRNFTSYVGLLSLHSSDKPSKSTPEKHHVVPREWLTSNVEGFDFDSEDPRNIVYLSVRNKILAMQYLVLVFLELRDSETYKRLTESICRRYHLGWYGFWKNPYIDGAMVGFLAEKRKQELSERKTKYSAEYLRKCAEIYNSDSDKDRAYRTIAEKLLFPSTKRALVDILRKYGYLEANKNIRS